MSLATGSALPLLVAVACAAPVRAQESPVPTPGRTVAAKAFEGDPPGTYAQADLSYVLTSGNSRSSSLGFKGSFARRFLHNSFALEIGGLRASSSSGERVAVGTPEDFALEVPQAVPTAEDYYARGRYEYRARGRVFGSTGAGWERNRYSGIADRWVVDVGLGCVVASNEKQALRSVLAVTYTDENHAPAEPPRSAFLGARLGWDLRRTLVPGTTLSHTLVLDQSLEDARARRLDSQLGLEVAMTETLGLKVNWRLLFNNQPPFVEVPLLSAEGVASGRSVLAPYRKLDQGLSVSLVFTRAPAREP